MKRHTHFSIVQRCHYKIRSSETVIENTNNLTINQKFSVDIITLIPFTTYYYIIQVISSVGNTSTDIMTFITNQLGINTVSIFNNYGVTVLCTTPSLAPSTF